MFCKYCGKQIPDQSEFCPECGKGLKANKAEKQENIRHQVKIPFILILLLVCGNTVLFWGKILLYGYGTSIVSLFDTLILVAGLIVLISFVNKKRIRTSAYRFTDLLPLACVWGPFSGLLATQKANFVWDHVGSYVWEGVWVLEAYVQPVVQLQGLWICLALAALGLGRSGKWRSAKIHKLILAVVFALCVLAGLVFVRPIMMSQDVPMETIAAAVAAGRIWTVLSWLWPLAILKTFRKLGAGQITTAGAVIALLGMKAGQWILLVIFLPLLNLGVTGYGLANGLAPLFTLLLLLFVGKKKSGKK